MLEEPRPCEVERWAPQLPLQTLRARLNYRRSHPGVGGGGKEPSDYWRGYATIGDVISSWPAISTPFDAAETPVDVANVYYNIVEIDDDPLSAWKRPGRASLYSPDEVRLLAEPVGTIQRLRS